MKSSAPTRASLEEIEDAKAIAEKLTVLAQPHRRGERGDMTDALGTFARREFAGSKERDCGRLCYEAGQSYIRKVARWRRAKGVPQRDLIVDETPSNHGDLDATVVANWGHEIKRCEEAMKCSGLTGFYAANALVLDNVPPPSELYGPVKRALFQLAICLGFYGKNTERT